MVTRARSSDAAVTGQAAAQLPALRGRGTDAADLEILVAEATAAVAQLEALPADAAWLDADVTAEHAITALTDAVHAVLFPPVLAPVPLEVLSDFTALFDDTMFSTLVPDLLDAHARAVEHHPELAAIIRGARARRWLEKAGIIDDALEAFERAIAAQCVAANQLQPHSGILADTVPALRRRVQAMLETRQATARAAIAAAAEADAQIALVRAEAFERRRQQLAARAERLPGSRLLMLPGELDPITARLLAHHLERAESPERLDQLEQAIESAEASR